MEADGTYIEYLGSQLGPTKLNMHGSPCESVHANESNELE